MCVVLLGLLTLKTLHLVLLKRATSRDSVPERLVMVSGLRNGKILKNTRFHHKSAGTVIKMTSIAKFYTDLESAQNYENFECYYDAELQKSSFSTYSSVQTSAPLRFAPKQGKTPFFLFFHSKEHQITLLKWPRACL